MKQIRNTKFYLYAILILIAYGVICKFLLLPAIIWVKYSSSEMQTMEHYSALGYAISMYQQDHNDVYPLPLDEVKPYCYSTMRDYFFANPTHHFVYRVPDSNQERAPMCWESKPHSMSRKGPPYKRCILYSDSSTVAVKEEDFLEEMKTLGIEDPNISISKLSNIGIQ